MQSWKNIPLWKIGRNVPLMKTGKNVPLMTCFEMTGDF